MKIRQGFVSNSSSSSFIISTRNITVEQRDAILHHEDFINNIKETNPEEFEKYKNTLFQYYDDGIWDVQENHEYEVIKAWTTMDNFYLVDFITEYLKVDKKEILNYEDDCHYWGSPFEKDDEI